MDRSRRWVVLAAALLLAGCATRSDPHLQTLAVATVTAGGEAVVGVDCTLRNDRGRWQVVTPGQVSVHRSRQPLTLDCGNTQWQAVGGHGTSAASRGAPGRGALAGAAGGVALGVMLAASGGLIALVAAPVAVAGAVVGAGAGAAFGHYAVEAQSYPDSIVVVVEPRPALVR